MKRLLTLLACTVASLHAQDPAPPPAAAKVDGRVAFSLKAPNAKEVSLRGQWRKEPLPLAKAENGDWALTVDAVPAGVWEYSFGVDGLNVMDPSNPAFKPQRQPGKSILHVPSNPAAPWDWQEVPHGTIHTHGYASKALGRPRELMVYTPPGYEQALDKKFPLLVLQHGSGDNQRTWTEHGKAHWIFDNLLAQGKTVPFVVLMIDGHPLGQFSRETPEARRASAMGAFQKELFEDAIPLVEALYRVEKDPAQRAIAGLSMGGGQSLSTGLANLDRFGWVGAFSSAPPAPGAIDKALADAAGTNRSLRLLWIACGKDDFLRQMNEKLIETLKEKSVQHEWALTDGDHSWPVWRRYLADFAPRLFKENKASGEAAK